MTILATSSLVDPALRDRAFIAQLHRLRRRQGPPNALAHLLQTLRPWEKALGDALWAEIEAVQAGADEPALASLKQRILAPGA